MISRCVLMAMAGVLGVGPAAAQAGKTPAFDVVSVRVNDTGGHGMDIDLEKNSFTATNVTLLNLIAEAYGIKSDLVANAPGWMSSLRYNVQAKVLDRADVNLEQMTEKERQPVLQAMLVDRFQLKVHEETKTLPVYELVVGKGGAKIKPPPTAEGAEAMAHDGNYSVHHGAMTGQGVTIARLCDVLTEVVRRKVIDKTGLSGGYDLTLNWTPDDDATNGKDSGAVDAAPSVFIAVQEQLGLKLQASKGPVQTLVIDHAEKATEN